MTHPLVAARHKLEPLWLDDTPGPALGAPEGAAAFDDLAFQTRPFYRGTP